MAKEDKKEAPQEKKGASKHPNYVKCTVTCACGNTLELYYTTPTASTDLPLTKPAA